VGVNRKVFLFPENWIEPELKRIVLHFSAKWKTNSCKRRNQINAETAFANYLISLTAWHSRNRRIFSGGRGYDTTLHVFGRTTGAEPHLYYYRR
jgi:hypothetical protein